MPASVVVVHDEPEFIDQLTSALVLAGHGVVAFTDPMAALSAFDAEGDLEVLVTRIRFGPGKLHGVALARMARSKRPGIRVLFTALPEFSEYAEGLGKFMPMPVSVTDVVAAVRSLIGSDHPPLPMTLPDRERIADQ
jgi:DNA-binding NtrC family response regulator